MQRLPYQKFVQYIQQFPPVLSVDTVWLANNRMTIFDPVRRDKPWLTINKGDSKYQWMYEDAFFPSGSTHFVAVDLVALANAKARSRFDNNQIDLTKNRKE